MQPEATDPEKAGTAQDGSTEHFLVSWDGEDDPKNPKNWSELRKWATVTLVATIAFIPYVRCGISIGSIRWQIGPHG